MASTPLVILLAGAPAGGKSTIAHEFKSLFESRTSRKLYWLATDAIRKAVDCQRYEEPIKQGIYDAMFAVAKGLNAEGLDILLDANFISAQRRAAFLDLKANNSNPLVALVHCDLATREQRNASRAEDQQVDLDYLHAAHLAAKEFLPNADLVLNSQTHTASQCAQQLLAFLENPQ